MKILSHLFKLLIFILKNGSKGITTNTHHLGFITTLGGKMYTKFERKEDTSLKVLEDGRLAQLVRARGS